MIGTIIKKKLVARETLSVTFKVDEKIEFIPGQYITISLINPPYHDAEGDSRIFSINNSPKEKGILQVATRLRLTAFKNSLKELPVGTKVTIDPPGGHFILPDEISSPLVFIAGGIGITPFMSILRYLAEKKPEIRVTLIYSNRDQESAAFIDELSTLDKKMNHFKLIAIMTNDYAWQGESRHINTQLIKDYFPVPGENIYYLAGPPAMVKTIYTTLKDAGIEESHIKTENFDGY